MSTIPGYDLEDYVTWNYDLVVEEIGECNVSLGMAEACGTATKMRPRFTMEQLQKVLVHFEPYREQIERTLGWYSEEESGSWRDYAGHAFLFVGDEVYEAGRREVDTIVKEIEFGGAVGGGKTGMVAGLTDDESKDESIGTSDSGGIEKDQKLPDS